MNEFEGGTAVITGGASGIGLALAERFGEARMNVVLADIQEDALQRAVKHLEERQVKVLGVVTNTMLQDSVQSLAERAIAEFGKVHVLCNNAGVAATTGAMGRGIWDVPAADWDWVLGVNFHGVLYGIQAFVPHMLEHGERGHVVNTASLAGLLGGGGTYGVSKHAVVALTETLYNDLKARGAKVGASVLCPGMVSTNIFDAERNRPVALKGDTAATSNDMLALGKAMLAKGKQPAEIADIVFEGIGKEALYILPHPAWDDFLKDRFEAILGRAGPSVIDFAEMQRRQAAGEQF